MTAYRIEAEAATDRDRVHRNLAVDTREFGCDHLGIALEIGFGEQDHRMCATLESQGHVALEQASIHFLAEGSGDEDDVEIRRDHLLAHVVRALIVCGAARELRPAWHDPDDRACGVEPDPVADDREVDRRCSSSKTVGDPCAHFALSGQNVVLAAMLDRDPSRNQPELSKRRECGAPRVVPAERREFRHPCIVVDACPYGDDPRRSSLHPARTE